MPKPFPEEFRRDVIAVARKGEASRRQIAKDFGISEGCLHGWLKIADREDGINAGAKTSGSDESAELKEAADPVRDHRSFRLRESVPISGICR